MSAAEHAIVSCFTERAQGFSQCFRQMCLSLIRVLPGGEDMLKVSLYDLSKGRITFRQTRSRTGSAFLRLVDYESSTLS
jgi:hypothetical protein